MADSESSESPIMAQTGPQQPTIIAQAGGVAVVPQLHSCHIEGPVNISVNTSSAPVLNSGITIKRVSEKLKANLRNTFGSILEGVALKGTPTLLNDIYTKLYIIQGEREGTHNEHEVWDIDSFKKPQSSQEFPIDLNDIFKPLPDKKDKEVERHFRVVLTKGIAGIGKTVSVHKFILDWAEGKANQDVDLMIVLPFRDLNTLIEEGYSLQELLEEFYPELKDVRDYENCNIVLIFDGLDESKLPLNFHNNRRTSNIKRKCSVDVLLTNLIQADRLLPSARVWITSRPAAIHKVSTWGQTAYRLTEIQGFSDPQKEEYFRKKIQDENLADRVVSHIKTSRSLHIMCHIPVFCWISATVFSIPNILDTAPENIPTSLTAMFTRFLLHQTQKKNEKYYGKHDTMPLSETDMRIIFKLGKLAFVNLEKQNLVFSEKDLSDHAIDITDVSVQSGVFTEVVKEEDPTIREKWYSFIHLTIQEYFAAFYVFYLFATEGSNPFSFRHTRNPHHRGFRYDYDDDYDDYDDEYEFRGEYSDEYAVQQTVSQEVETLHDLHKAAISKALESRNGHLDVFVRFLLGLSMDVSMWRHFPLQISKDQISIERTIQFLKSKLKEKDERKLPSAERCINILHCLTELKDNSLVKEIQWFMTSKRQPNQKINAAQCTALAYMITTSDEVMEEFDLTKYNTSREGQKRLIPAVGHCVRAKLADCSLSEKCCKTVAQALQSSNSHLTELDLSHNWLYTSSLALADGLKSPNCRLTFLDLSFVNLEKSGQALLNSILLGSHDQPSTLRLCGCALKQDICDILAKAMERPSVQLKNLDISYNPLLSDAGIETFLQRLLSKKCDLETLRLCACGVTKKSCTMLARVLKQSSLRELDLSSNNLGDEGVKLVCTGLMSPHCRLQTLGMRDYNLNKGSCAALAPVLWSFSELKDLNLSDNDLSNAGLRLLLVGLRNPNCFLRILRMSGCQITEHGCALLVSALIRNPHHLEELDLSYNHPGDRGIQLLSARLKDQHFRLQTLNMDHGGERRLKWGMKKYSVDLTFVWTSEVEISEDRKTATRGYTFYCPFNLYDSDNDMGETTKQDSHIKIKCVQRLSGERFYWEVDWKGMISIGVKHKGALPYFQYDKFLLVCSKYQYLTIRDDGVSAKWLSHVKMPNPDPRRIGVLLDWPAGTLSYYSVTRHERTFLHTYHHMFSTPVEPLFTFSPPHPEDGIGSVTLCRI